MLVVPALVGPAFLVLPLAGLLIRALWTTLPQRLAEPQVLEALRLSLACGTVATAVCLLLGVLLAWLLARVPFPGRRLVRALDTVSLGLPPVVGGVALVLGRSGLVGQWLESSFGITLPFTAAGVVVAEAFVATSFLVISVEGALRGTTRTMPPALYLALETEPEAAGRAQPRPARRLRDHPGQTARPIGERAMTFADITPVALADLDLTPGRQIWPSVEAAETHAYPA